MIDTISKELAAEIVAALDDTRTITAVEHLPRRLTVRFGPKLGVSSRRIVDAETEVIRKYCNAPYLLYSDNGNYHFSLVCN